MGGARVQRRRLPTEPRPLCLLYSCSTTLAQTCDTSNSRKISEERLVWDVLSNVLSGPTTAPATVTHSGQNQPVTTDSSPERGTAEVNTRRRLALNATITGMRIARSGAERSALHASRARLGQTGPDCKPEYVGKIYKPDHSKPWRVANIHY